MKFKINKKKMIKNLILLLFPILIICFSCFVIKNMMNKNYYTVHSRVKQIGEKSTDDAKVIGWIQVQGTNIDYPIINYDDIHKVNYEYLWLASQYFEGENRKVIYGHNILNVSNTPLVNENGHTKFEPLMGFVYDDFAKKNLYINYTYNDEDYVYKIYAVSFQSIDDEIGQSYLNGDMTDNYIKEAKEDSIYDYDVDVNSSDEIISLITCTRYFGLNGKTQFRVDARKLRENEKIEKYSVSTNQNYDELNQNSL